MRRLPHTPTLFPYTTLFRSCYPDVLTEVNAYTVHVETAGTYTIGETVLDSRSWRIERPNARVARSEEHTSELQSQSNIVCRLLLEKKKKKKFNNSINYI